MERSLRPAQRAAASLITLADMPIQVLSWTKMYEQLNTAQIGFDVIHPQISLTITDPAQLQAFANGAALSFSISLADVPAGMFELKANALHLEMVGASSTQSSNVWVTHSGEWSMNRRTDGSVTTHVSAPAARKCSASRRLGTLTPYPRESAVELRVGTTLLVLGTGVAATFRLETAPPSAMDLSQLSAIHVTVDCIGYAPADCRRSGEDYAGNRGDCSGSEDRSSGCLTSGSPRARQTRPSLSKRQIRQRAELWTTPLLMPLP